MYQPDDAFNVLLTIASATASLIRVTHETISIFISGCLVFRR